MLNQDQRDRIEALLLREREQLTGLLEQFDEDTQDARERSGEISLYRFHPADLGTEMMEKEKEFLLASNEGRRLYEVDAALRRLYASPEEFGKCERCGREIGFERLEVVPEARFCVEDQEAAEAPA
ncbi:MAG TPA: TraR/DksA C4-type zinc finger protein [Longimicrobiaceae bacterium]|nr:TraR/DksA C4-type zinc finger protein [Longimicrobiaceae bacterium]